MTQQTVKKRLCVAKDADLLLSGILCGVIRPEPQTRELAFDGMRYSIGRDPDWCIVADVMGRDRLRAAIALAKETP